MFSECRPSEIVRGFPLKRGTDENHPSGQPPGQHDGSSGQGRGGYPQSSGSRGMRGPGDALPETLRRPPRNQRAAPAAGSAWQAVWKGLSQRSAPRATSAQKPAGSRAARSCQSRYLPGGSPAGRPASLQQRWPVTGTRPSGDGRLRAHNARTRAAASAIGNPPPPSTPRPAPLTPEQPPPPAKDRLRGGAGGAVPGAPRAGGAFCSSRHGAGSTSADSLVGAGLRERPAPRETCLHPSQPWEHHKAVTQERATQRDTHPNAPLLSTSLPCTLRDTCRGTPCNHTTLGMSPAQPCR